MQQSRPGFRFSWVQSSVNLKKKPPTHIKNSKNEENHDDGTQRFRESLAR